jgi:beta-barrel assembly-enhancing protease
MNIKLKKSIFIVALCCTSLMQVQAQKWLKTVLKKADNINLMSIQDDIALGKKVKEEIANDPKTYPMLPEAGNEAIYGYIKKLTFKILDNGNVEHRNDFEWDVHIIKDDKTLNAFCTPGGHIYVYTALIKFLDSEDQLVGVLGHEIAHAAKRHSTSQLTKMYGISDLASMLASAASGKSSSADKQKQAQQVAQMTAQLASLKFSRGHETEADECSVRYLCGTEYNAAGAAGFFKKMEGKGSPPQFLSTHPNPGNRVQEIEKNKNLMHCTGNSTNTETYARMKALLG